MSAKKGIKHFGAAISDDVLKMKQEGKTHREISEIYGFKDKYVIKSLIKRHNQKKRQLEAGIMPKPKGRLKKTMLVLK